MSEDVALMVIRMLSDTAREKAKTFGAQGNWLAVTMCSEHVKIYEEVAAKYLEAVRNQNGNAAAAVSENERANKAEADVLALTTERDDAKLAFESSNDHVGLLQADVDALTTALRTYGTHSEDCQLSREIGGDGWCPCHGEKRIGAEPDCPRRHRCTCGFSALNAPEKTPTEDAGRSASPPLFDFHAHLHYQREWSRETFGPGARTYGVVNHIRKELCEIEADPEDISEWIDVVILALDGAWRAGHTPESIIAALVAKQAKNEARAWPDWRTLSEHVPIEHVREGDSERRRADQHDGLLRAHAPDVEAKKDVAAILASLTPQEPR